MRTRLALNALAAVVAAAMPVWAAAAFASGPAPPGKQTIQITCGGGLGTITVSVPKPEKSNGAGQIVGHKGHGIPVSLTFTLTDLTTGVVLDSETHATGHGHAHRHQAKTTCSAVFFEGTAAAFFGSQLPAGVSATDTIQASFTVTVVLKP